MLDAAGVSRAVLAGASMGAHTLLWLALHHPERVAGLVVITPGYDPERADDPQRLARWDALATGLREAGIEGFLAAQGTDGVPERWRETMVTVTRQRLSQHDDLAAVADALSAVPRSHPFGGLDELGAIAAPTTVVAPRMSPIRAIPRPSGRPTRPPSRARSSCSTRPGARRWPGRAASSRGSSRTSRRARHGEAATRPAGRPGRTRTAA